jgi:8-oxo-dGTP diphosphatase
VGQPKRSVAGIAIEGGALFIARRKAGGDLGGKWEFPGGKVENGESDRAALVREFGEEFGLSIETGPLLASASFEHRDDTFSLYAYRIFFNKLDRIRLAEHEQWRWAALDEIRRLDFAGSDLRLLPGLELHLKHETGVHQ